MNILVTGARGFVGTNLVRYFGRKGRVVAAGRGPTPLSPLPEGAAGFLAFDVTDEAATRAAIRSAEVEAVIHLAAAKNVADCEKDPEMAHRLNALGARNVARACRDAGAHLAYVSSDLVFEGTRGGYREGDVPEPRLVYGRTKLEGERLSAAEHADTAICRTAGVYGVGYPLFLRARTELLAGRPMEAFTDVYNTPTYAMNLAEMLEAVIERRLRGVFHTAGSERVNRYDLLAQFAEAFGIDRSLVQPDVRAPGKGDLLLSDSALSTAFSAAAIGIRFLGVNESMKRLKEEMR